MFWNWKLNKSKSAIQNKTRVVLRLPSNTAGNSNDSSFLHTLLLNHGQDGAFKSIF